MIMTELPWLVAAFVTGLLSAGHCLPMCGGIAVALGQQTRGDPAWLRAMKLSAHGTGRIMTYAVLGWTLGALVMLLPLQKLETLAVAVRVLSGLMLIAMGLYIGRWWLGLTKLERLGALLWRPVKKWFARVLQNKGLAPSLLAGMLWGLLPCGLVYSALTVAAARMNAADAALYMLAFGLGTLPAMLLPALLSSSFQFSNALRRVSALALIGFGLWIAWHNGAGLWSANDPHQHHHHHSLSAN